jgi:hypothetical protein
MIPAALEIALGAAEGALRRLAEERDALTAMDPRLAPGMEAAHAALGRLHKALGRRLDSATVAQIAADLTLGPCPFGTTLRRWADTIAKIGDHIDRETPAPRGAA